MNDGRETQMPPPLYGRSLCTEAAMRARMTEAEFWELVFGGAGDVDYDPDEDPWAPTAEDPALGSPCPECGAAGACAYDVEGRPLIHTTPNEDDPQ